MDFDDLEPLAGGFSGETFVAEVAGEKVVVRLYAERGASRGAAAVEIDAAVLRLVRGRLPVPEVLVVRKPSAVPAIPGMLVTSFLPGERLDLCLPDLSEPARVKVARSLGIALARLAQMPMLAPGAFSDPGLTIEAWAEAPDLPGWVRYQRANSALADWPADAYDGLCTVAATAQGLLNELDRVCLVHSDFNPKNLLIDPATGELAGLLDWEFAHAGSPMTDLGNLLRFDRDPDFAAGVLDGYLELAGHLDGLGGPAARQRLVELARSADLAALTELAGRRGTNPVADRADAQLRAIATSRDLHAMAPI
jgi:aminoglycoside phosphotransferase (APT) family kinase protein